MAYDEEFTPSFCPHCGALMDAAGGLTRRKE
jgi:hypothetical protein